MFKRVYLYYQTSACGRACESLPRTLACWGGSQCHSAGVCTGEAEVRAGLKVQQDNEFETWKTQTQVAQYTLRLCYLLCVFDEVKLLLCTWLSSSLHGMVYQGTSEKQNNISVTQSQSESSMARKKKM